MQIQISEVHPVNASIKSTEDRKICMGPPPPIRLNLLECTYIIDVKFSSWIKNINFGFYPDTDVC